MATEYNLTGWESASYGEQRFANGGVAPAAGTSVQGSTARTGTYRLQIATVNSASNLVSMPAGSVTGTSGTTTAGQHKRVTARAYLRIDAQTVPFGNSQIRLFGLGADESDVNSVNVWMDGPRQLTLKIGSGFPTIGGGGYTIGVASITALACIGVTGVATATTAAPHGFQTGANIAIAGAVPAAYNGTFVITVTGATTFNYVLGSTQVNSTGTRTATYVGGPTTGFLGAIAASTWYRFILDVDYLVGVSPVTAVTATLSVAEDLAVPVYNQSMNVTANLGAGVDTMGKVTFCSVRIRGGFDYQVTMSVDDVSYLAASGTDAVAALTLPTESKVFYVPATAVGRTLMTVSAGSDQIVTLAAGATLAGVVTPSIGNTWGGTTLANVTERPIDLSGAGARGAFFESSNASGSLVMFSHGSAAGLGIASIGAWKVYRNGQVASGTGTIETLLGLLSQSGTWGTIYQDSNGAQTPAGIVSWTPTDTSTFDLTPFGVRKQNGTQQSFLGNIMSEVLGS